MDIALNFNEGKMVKKEINPRWGLIKLHFFNFKKAILLRTKSDVRSRIPLGPFGTIITPTFYNKHSQMFTLGGTTTVQKGETAQIVVQALPFMRHV